jgi:hypothetical protein
LAILGLAQQELDLLNATLTAELANLALADNVQQTQIQVCASNGSTR